MRLIPWAGYVSVMRSDSLSAVHSRADLCALEASDDTPARLRSAQAAGEIVWCEKHRFTTRSRIVWIDFMDYAEGRQTLPRRARSC